MQINRILPALGIAAVAAALAGSVSQDNLTKLTQTNGLAIARDDSRRIALRSVAEPTLIARQNGWSQRFSLTAVFENTGSHREVIRLLSMLVYDPNSKLRRVEIVPGAITLDAGRSVAVDLQAVTKDNDCIEQKPAIFWQLTRSESCFPLNGFLEIQNEAIPTESNGKVIDLPCQAQKSSHCPGTQYRLESLRLASREGRETESWLLLGASLLAFLTILGAAVLSAKSGRGILDEMVGTPTWDLNNSWSTNAAIAGSIVTSLLVFSFLPAETQILPRAGYAVLSLLIAGSLAVAPMVYAMSRKEVQHRGEVVQGGSVAGLFGTGFITLAAAFAQIGILWLLLCELARNAILTETTVKIIGWGLLVMASALTIYGVRTLRLSAIAGKPSIVPPSSAALAPALNWPLL